MIVIVKRTKLWGIKEDKKEGEPARVVHEAFKYNGYKLIGISFFSALLISVENTLPQNGQGLGAST